MKTQTLRLASLLGVVATGLVLIGCGKSDLPAARDAMVASSAANEAAAKDDHARKHFSRPNLFIRVSADLIDAGVRQPIDHTGPVHEVILGTDISGTSHTKGQVTAELIPDDDRAAIDLVLRATAASRNVGVHGPAVIDTVGDTTIAARKRIVIDRDGISAQPAAATATTHSTITDVEVNRGGPIIKKFADRRVDHEHARTDQISSQDTEQNVDQRMNRQIDPMVADANKAFTERFREPLRRQDLFPRQLRFSTTRAMLQVAVVEAKAAQLAAAGPPPKVVAGADLTLVLHESAVNNAAETAMAGRTFYEQKVRDAAAKLFGSLPKRPVKDKNREPWVITFAAEAPVSVMFAGDHVRMLIRGTRYVRGKHTYPAMDIMGEYAIQPAERGFKIVRQGDTDILPPGTGADGRTHLSFRDEILYDVLDFWCANVLQKQFVGHGFTPHGVLSKIGTLEPIQMQARDGWLVVAWRRVPGRGD